MTSSKPEVEEAVQILYAGSWFDGTVLGPVDPGAADPAKIRVSYGGQEYEMHPHEVRKKEPSQGEQAGDAEMEAAGKKNMNLSAEFVAELEKQLTNRGQTCDDIVPGTRGSRRFTPRPSEYSKPIVLGNSNRKLPKISGSKCRRPLRPQPILASRAEPLPPPPPWPGQNANAFFLIFLFFDSVF